MTATADRIGPKHLARCQREATRDVIYLFQTRSVVWTTEPPGYEWDSDTMRKAGDNDDDDDPQELTDEGMLDRDCAVETWRVEGVWLDRDEAEAWGRAHDYRFAGGWRVYGVCSDGELAEMLKTYELSPIPSTSNQ